MRTGHDRRVFVASAVVVVLMLAAVGWKVYDDVLDLDGCDSPREYSLSNSCATPFTAEDFAAGRARIEAYVRSLRPYGAVIGYTYSNLTDEWRSLDWTRVAVVDPSGGVHPCWGDASAALWASDPHTTHGQPTYGGCEVPPVEAGDYQLEYDGRPVDMIELLPG